VRERDVVASVLDGAGLDGAVVLAEVDAGWPLDVLRDTHLDLAGRLGVFGVPTFVTAGDAVFVRLMHRPEGDAKVAITSIDRVVDLLEGWPDLNEFKHTRIAR
jgi:predicted DsbA family dithiol-disulfide isomerase